MHHEWPLYPIPEHEGVDMKALPEMEVLLQEGTWPTWPAGYLQIASAQGSVRSWRFWLQSAILSRQMPARVKQ